jgi:hypothetical protein
VSGPVPMASANPPEFGGDAQRSARYGHLIGRLRAREITMEEATELFNLMQAMLRISESARVAALRMTAASTPTTPSPVTPRVPSTTAPSVASEDLFLVGLLAMGAGAGLLAAMAKRLSSAPSPPEERRTRDPRGASP